MAEKVIRVCDVCGQPATQTVGIRIRNRNFSKDLCDAHLRELSAGAKSVRRGRPRGTTASPAGGSTTRSKSRKTTRRAAKSAA